ncbi:MAG: ATP-binding protein, partial [Chloroflexi bacterium]|nr:ATP-binding protein [Chloroflexota bacterium]
MPTQDVFSRELLSQPIEARLAYFRDKIIAHPRLMEAHSALINAIRRPAGASLILVFGPTGVGKTTLRLRVEKQLIEEALSDLEEDRGRIPVVGMEAVAPGSGNFDWKDYYTRALIALDEPLIKHKIDYGVPGIHRDGSGRLVVGHGVVASKLRWALEQCLRHRRLAAFIVDEAQHFKKMASGRRLLHQMDTLKSLAGMTDTVHVLIGTYELLSLANLSAQLSRRSIEICFPRYRPDCDDEIRAFKSVLLTFQRHLPLIEEPDLVGRYEYFYERSVGCVGVLKNWLNRALAAALEDGQLSLTHKYLERHAAPTRKLLRMAREIREGEEALLERAEERAELGALLGMGAGATRVGAARPGTKEQQQQTRSVSRRQGG